MYIHVCYKGVINRRLPLCISRWVIAHDHPFTKAWINRVGILLILRAHYEHITSLALTWNGINDWAESYRLQTLYRIE